MSKPPLDGGRGDGRFRIGTPTAVTNPLRLGVTRQGRPRGGRRFIRSADDIPRARTDAVRMEEFDRLKGMAMMSPHGRFELRYVREREQSRRAASSSRAKRTSELAAAAREKHRGLFAQ